jgi:hypothetical protein
MIKPKSVWIVRTTGEAIRVEDAPFTIYEDTGWELSLEWTREQMGITSPVDLVRLPYGEMWVDDEGLYKENRKVNGMATALYQASRRTTHPIVGDVVLVLTPGTKAEIRLNVLLENLVRN